MTVTLSKEDDKVLDQILEFVASNEDGKIYFTFSCSNAMCASYNLLSRKRLFTLQATFTISNKKENTICVSKTKKRY